MGIATPISFQQYFEKTLSGCGDDKEDGISGVATAQTQNIVENGGMPDALHPDRDIFGNLS
jgi:hypothetical protein